MGFPYIQVFINFSKPGQILNRSCKQFVFRNFYFAGLTRLLIFIKIYYEIKLNIPNFLY